MDVAGTWLQPIMLSDRAMMSASGTHDDTRARQVRAEAAATLCTLLVGLAGAFSPAGASLRESGGAERQGGAVASPVVVATTTRVSRPALTHLKT